MNELLDIIVAATASVFRLEMSELCTKSRKREVVVARRAAAWLCRSEDIPARMLAEKFDTTRWCINRMQTEARNNDDVWFWTKVKEIREKTSNEIAHK